MCYTSYNNKINILKINLHLIIANFYKIQKKNIAKFN